MAFAVAAGHDLTAEAAAEVLRAGGNAVDACIAAAFMSGFAEPVLSSLLGGGFLLVVPVGGKPVCLDAFVQTPRRKLQAHETDQREIIVDFGAAEQIFHTGGGTIATPGLVSGLFAAHARFGRLPMRELASQAATKARGGVAINSFQAHVLDLVKPIFSMHPSSLAIYGSGDGLLQAGDRYANPELADVIETLAREGQRFFREGEIAQGLLALDGTHLIAADLTGHEMHWREPLEIRRGQTAILLNPPPTLGGVQIALALLALPAKPPARTLAKIFAELSRLRRTTDIDAQPDAAAALLLDPELVAMLCATLANHSTATRGTTHISVIDAQGMGAALTLSNGEGCGLVMPGTGLMPNNMLGEEDLVKGGPQNWTPDRRLASMMCPMALRDGDGSLTMMGSGGSNRIRSALIQVALHLIDASTDLETAIRAPRLHYEHGTRHGLDVEDDGSEGLRAALLPEWPEATFWPPGSMYFGGAHAVRQTVDGGVEAAGDPRRAGVGIIG